MADENNAKSNPDKLAQAKLALSGEEKLSSWRKAGEDLEKRRQEAIRSMASNEQKKVWDEAEKSRLGKIEAQKKLAELEAGRRLTEEEKRKKLSEEQIKKDEQLEAERLAKINEIIKSQQEIDLIKKKPDAGPSPIRTLTRDIGEAIGKEKLSAGKILTTTPDKESLAPTQGEGLGRSLLIGVGVILIIGGLTAVLWSVLQRQITSIATVTAPRQGLLFADEQVAIDLDKNGADQARQELRTKSLGAPENKEKVQEIYFVYQTKEQATDGLVMKTVEANPRVLATKLNLNLPDEFLRFLEPQMMFGFYYGHQTAPFYVFKTKSYKNTADALINKEGLIASELLSPVIDASTTEKIKNGQFQDKMVRNYDTRLMLDETNTVIALYSWLDKNTLVFTTNENTFGSILDSFLSPKRVAK